MQLNLIKEITKINNTITLQQLIDIVEIWKDNKIMNRDNIHIFDNTKRIFKTKYNNINTCELLSICIILIDNKLV